jgi:lipid-A-disaccharide synthase
MKKRVFLVAGETSGDQLGGALMRALQNSAPGGFEFSGVGGPAMTAAGLVSLFPLEEIAVNGILPVLARLPALLRRIDQTATAVVAAKPDALVIIDSPDFTHRVARRVRKLLPAMPIIDYVSPTVWAWRQGRARQMCAYIDHVLALLPFEPDAYRRLQGPPCSYVGHPLVERAAELKPGPEDLKRRAEEPPLVVLLPGSRHSEIARLMPVFGAALERLVAQAGSVEAVLPAVPHLAQEIENQIAQWPIKPRIVRTEAEKYASFRRARAALAASGTVTLELALAEVPQIVAYRVSPAEAWLRPFIKVPSIVLPNLILAENVVPEFLQEDCTPEKLAAALAGLLADGQENRHERQRQVAAFPGVARRLLLAEGETPSHRAAALVGEIIAKRANPLS